MPSPSNTSRTQVRRKPQRAHHDAATIRAVIDEMRDADRRAD